MEYFFYDDNFCYDIGCLIDLFDFDEASINALPDDWEIEVQQTTLEKIFVLKKSFVVDAVLTATDKWEERFPEDSNGSLLHEIQKAIEASIDIEKLNQLLPSLYFPNGHKEFIRKQDLLDHIS